MRVKGRVPPHRRNHRMPPMLNDGSHNAFDVGTWVGADVERSGDLESREHRWGGWSRLVSPEGVVGVAGGALGVERCEIRFVQGQVLSPATDQVWVG